MKNKVRRLGALGAECALALALLLAVLAGFQSARAQQSSATYTVTTTNNMGPGSLRRALLQANARPGADTILFDIPGCTAISSCVISLLTPLPVISDALSIAGPGTIRLTIDAGRNFRVLDIAAVPVSIADITIQNGTAAEEGGGIRSLGDLTLTGTRLLNNLSEGDGGGVYAAGELVVVGGHFEGNTALSEGGGLYADAGLLLENSNFISNSASSLGGGVYAEGVVSLTGSRFERNYGAFGGGGLYARDAVTATGTLFLSNIAEFGSLGGGISAMGNARLTEAHFENNRSGGGAGVYTGEDLILEESVFIGNIADSDNGGGASGYGSVWVTGGRFEGNSSVGDGAGLFGGSNPNSTVSVTGTLFLSNTAGLSSSGGGLFSYRDVEISQAWFENNRSNYDGGGVRVSGELVLESTTFLSNTAENGYGGGAYSEGAARISGSRFEQNTAEEGGGFNTYSTAVLTDTRFVGNSAYAGAGLYASEATQISQGWFEGNVATDGGGIYARDRLELGNTTILSNTADEDGGGVMVLGDVMVTGGRFEGNSADDDGGGLLGFANIELTESLFAGNVARNGAGGGVSAAPLVTAAAALGGGRVMSVTHSVFTGNTAAFYGGGLSSFAPLLMENTLLSGNKADVGGGIYLAMAGSQVANSLFAYNIAHTAGAALAYEAPGTLEIKHATIAGHAGNSAPAVVFRAGLLRLSNAIITDHPIGIWNINGVLQEDYNLFYQNGVDIDGAASGGTNNVSGDPNFVDPQSGDFHLGAGSAALDVGQDAGLGVDFEGHSRPLGGGFDIGFDEADLMDGLAVSYTPTPTLTTYVPATFTASVTAGSDVSYSWDFGDGSPPQAGNPIEHIYTAPGTYLVTVTATNTSGSLSTSVEVTVLAGEMPPLEHTVYLPHIQR